MRARLRDGYKRRLSSPFEAAAERKRKSQTVRIAMTTSAHERENERRRGSRRSPTERNIKRCNFRTDAKSRYSNHLGRNYALVAACIVDYRLVGARARVVTDGSYCNRRRSRRKWPLRSQRVWLLLLI